MIFLLIFEFAICAMFKDEAPFFKEWIEYHRLIGIEHFWLYNNNSQDEYLEVLTPYIKQGIVDLIDWPSPIGKNWSHAQGFAYTDAVRRAKNKTKWVAMIDIDEFIVPTKGKEDFVKTMREFEKVPQCGGVVLNWQMFGTSHIYELSPGQLMIEALLYRAPLDYSVNQHVKTICRPERVKDFSIHIAHYKEGFRHFTISKGGEPDLVLQPIDHRIRLNHYWTRTKQYMDEVKVPRRALCNDKPYTQEQIDQFEVELNVEYDDAILQYVPELKKRLQS